MPVAIRIDVISGCAAAIEIARMGVRDYDAKLSQFLTPDPLYFEDLEKCQGSPLQCSLYGYAAGNPISFVDPTGTDQQHDAAMRAGQDYAAAMAYDLDPERIVVEGVVTAAVIGRELAPVAAGAAI